jgi:hypothetical protein
MLKAPEGSCFITSDNPIAVLNQFCADTEPHRNFAGFSKSGFQLLMPISPELCLFFYDAKIYKVGSRRLRLISLSKDDVEVVNALQIQSAEDYVYFHKTQLENEIQSLIRCYAPSRVPVKDCLRTFPGPTEHEEILHLRNLSVKLPKPWCFCRLRRHVAYRAGDRRDPAWSALIEELMGDIEKHPNEDDIHTRLEKILADPTTLKNIHVQ